MELATVVLTREAEDNRRLAVRLREVGLTVVEWPALVTRLLPVSAGELTGGHPLADFAAIAVSSRRAVSALAVLADELAGYRGLLAAVGKGTAAALARLAGRPPDLVGSGTGQALGRELAGRLGPGALALHPRGELSVGTMQAELRDRGVELVERVVYETVAPAASPLELANEAVVVLTSPSAVDRFEACHPGALVRLRVVAIGPTTARAAVRQGACRVATASQPDDAGLLASIVATIGGGANGKPSV